MIKSKCDEIEKKVTYSEESYFCFHCGNKTIMECAGEYRRRSSPDDDFQYFYIYELLKCPVCDMPTLIESYGDQETLHSSEELIITTLFPHGLLEKEAVPKDIFVAYESALQVRNKDFHLCALALRRTLEMILVNNGATKWGLEDKIKEMVAKGILPEPLKDISFITKKLGDAVAHGKVEQKFRQADIVTLFTLIEYIIEYLYIIPYKLTLLKNRAEVV